MALAERTVNGRKRGRKKRSKRMIEVIRRDPKLKGNWRYVRESPSLLYLRDDGMIVEPRAALSGYEDGSWTTQWYVGHPILGPMTELHEERLTRDSEGWPGPDRFWAPHGTVPEPYYGLPWTRHYED